MFIYEDKHRSVAVVIPAYQEERLIGVTLSGIPLWVDLIVVVDDASTDQTFDEIQTFIEIQGEGRVIKVQRFTENQGVGRAICAGYQIAEEWGADIAVVMGADAQMDPAEITSLLNALQGDTVYVKGTRMRHPEVKLRMPAIRYWGNRVLSVFTGWIARMPHLEDAQCGFTALDLSWLSRLPLEELYPRYGFPNDLLLRLREAGAEVAQVEVTPIYGEERSTLSIPRVILPLLGVLSRGLIRRLFKVRPTSPLPVSRRER